MELFFIILHHTDLFYKLRHLFGTFKMMWHLFINHVGLRQIFQRTASWLVSYLSKIFLCLSNIGLPYVRFFPNMSGILVANYASGRNVKKCFNVRDFEIMHLMKSNRNDFTVRNI